MTRHPTPETAVAAWLSADRGGLLLTGDAAAADRLFQVAKDRIREDGRPVTVVADADALAETVDASTVPAHHRILARADVPTEVPPWLLRRCTLIVDVPHQLDPALVRAFVDAIDPVLPEVTVADPRVTDTVELLAHHGLADHGIDLDASVLAGCRGDTWDGIDLVHRYVLSPRVTSSDGSADASTHTSADAPTPSDADQPQGNNEPDPRHDAEPTPENPTTPTEHPDGHESADQTPPAPPTPPTPRKSGRSRDHRIWPGRRGALQEGADHGRVSRSRPWRDGLPVDVPATLAAAAPWQQARRAATGRRGMVLTRDDLRARNRVSRGAGLAILVVDASGSMGRGAIQAAKATAAALLDEGYRRRDRVAIVVARGRTASLGLAPTRAVSKARDCMRSLPTGGGTPLASALVMAADIAAPHDPERVRAVLLTDGRANVPLRPGLSGGAARRAAKDDALSALSLLRSRSGDVTVLPLAARSRRSRADPTAWFTAGTST